MINNTFKNLPYQFSPKVDNYINNLKFKKDHFHLIQFSLMPEDSDEYKRNWKGASYTDELGIDHVEIRPGLNIDDASLTICHEIEHFELVLNGFCIKAKPKLEDKHWKNVCSTLQSTFSDFLINQELEKSYAFSLNDYKQCLINDINVSLRQYVRESNPHMSVSIWFSLRICLAKMNLSKEQFQKLRQTFNMANKKYLFAKGEEIFRIVKDIGFNNPTNYKNLLIELIRYYNVSDYIQLYDSITKENIN